MVTVILLLDCFLVNLYPDIAAGIRDETKVMLITTLQKALRQRQPV